MTEKKLTSKQRSVLLFVRGFGLKYGYPPTLSEIARGFQWKSPNSASDALKMLERKGYIQRTLGIARGIKVIRDAP